MSIQEPEEEAAATNRQMLNMVFVLATPFLC